MITTTIEAQAVGHQWAEDRGRTGSAWSQFRFEDALGAVESGLPDQDRRDLAYAICDAAVARWSEVRQ